MTLRLVPPDPEWPLRYAAEAAGIRARLGAAILDLQHVGSTAVPGLISKPVIDIALAVERERDAEACIAPLMALGFRHRGPHGDDPRRRYFVRDERGVRVTQLHLYILPATAWRELLDFRDALRADDSLAAEYAAEKYRVAERVDWDKAAYAIAKGPFVMSALARFRATRTGGAIVRIPVALLLFLATACAPRVVGARPGSCAPAGGSAYEWGRAALRASGTGDELPGIIVTIQDRADSATIDAWTARLTKTSLEQSKSAIDITVRRSEVLPVPAGEYRVSVRSDGFRPLRAAVVLRGGYTDTLKILLQRVCPVD